MQLIAVIDVLNIGNLDLDEADRPLMCVYTTATREKVADLL